MKRTPSQSGLSSLGLAVLLVGGFVTIFDMFVVNLAIPSIRADLHANFAQIGFVIAGYQLAFGVLLIAGGRLGDMYGRRKAYVLGVVVFTVASALCCVAPTPNYLIAARVLQGMGAALLLPQVYTLIRVNFDAERRRQAFGWLGMTFGVAAISGQIVGGLIVHDNLLGLGWRIIFLINIPIGITIVLLCKTIVESRVLRAVGLDWIGTLLASLGLCSLLVPLMAGATLGWPIWTWALLVASIVFLLAFVRFERSLSERGGFPVIDIRLFTEREFAGGSIAIFLVYSTSASFFLCMALLLQTGFGLDPIAAGMIFVPANFAFTLASLAAPKLVSKFGNMVIVTGSLLYATSIAILVGQVVWSEQELSPLALIPALFAFGVGQALSMTPVINLVIGLVAERNAGMASGIISTMQQVGGAFGVAIVGMLFVNILGPGVDGGAQHSERYARAFAGAMSYNCFAAIVAALVIFWVHRVRSLNSSRQSGTVV
jgi:EmrB/QacA subfamily drug resistance transporter